MHGTALQLITRMVTHPGRTILAMQASIIGYDVVEECVFS